MRGTITAEYVVRLWRPPCNYMLHCSLAKSCQVEHAFSAPVDLAYLQIVPGCWTPYARAAVGGWLPLVATSSTSYLRGGSGVAGFYVGDIMVAVWRIREDGHACRIQGFQKTV